MWFWLYVVVLAVPPEKSHITLGGVIYPQFGNHCFNWDVQLVRKLWELLMNLNAHVLCLIKCIKIVINFCNKLKNFQSLIFLIVILSDGSIFNKNSAVLQISMDCWWHYYRIKSLEPEFKEFWVPAVHWLFIFTDMCWGPVHALIEKAFYTFISVYTTIFSCPADCKVGVIIIFLR